jgi:N-acetylneuraminate synthase
MATLAEIDEAVRTLRESGAGDLALLKCTSAYPAPPGEMDLRTIPHLSDAFNVPVGLSDHTMGPAVPVAAVALGACIIEKHFTLSRNDPGPDSTFSLEPTEFRAMADAVHIAEQALGGVRYGTGEIEESSKVFRRSLFVVEDVKVGEVFTADNVRVIRPGYGLPPRFYDEVIGRTASQDIKRGTPLEWQHLSGG